MRWHVYRFWKKKLTLRALLAIIVLNIVVSLLILHQRGGSNIILKIYYHNTHTPLLVTLDAYRTRYLSITDANTNEIKLITEKIHHKPIIDNTAFDWLRDEKYSHADPPPTTDQFNDNIFSSKSFLKDIVQPRSILKKSFYEPKVLINNADACSSRQNKIFIVCMIHSHRNNFMRRKTMRDTWLSQNKIVLFDLIEKTDQNQKLIPENFKNLEMVHLFIVGSATDQSSNQTDATNKSLLEESNHFRDIIVIDTIDNYKNLIYKHLTAVNWITKHCPQALYMVKLDDDVFVNIKPLSKHLVNKFGLNPIDSKFIYCSIMDNAKPQRHNSKWQVSLDTYPFEFYPRYCEGFSYITNMATVKLMQQQSKIIPRFWIDDVYFTGLLLHGFKQIEWYNYRPVLKYQFYDFWDLSSNENFLLRLYVGMHQLFNVRTVDYYKEDFFVILHMQKEMKHEVNYELELVTTSNATDLKKNDWPNSTQMCFTQSFFSTKNTTLLSNEIARCRGNEKYSFHFYNFCTQLWEVN